jgi:membrane protease YdiL (CAAX protease family)
MTAQAGSIDSNPAEAPPAQATPADSPPATVTAQPRRRRRAARWRPSAAVLAIVIAFVASQAAALAIVFAAGGEDDAPRGVVAAALILADLVIVGVVVAFARRGAEHLGAATLGIRRTAFGPALGWMLVVYFGVGAFEALWAALVGSGPDRGGVGTDHIGTAAAIALLFAIAVMAPIGEEIAFRGYLFPALTRWRGPWIGALVTALLFGLAHIATYPPEILPMMAAFGFGACILYWFTGSLLPCVALHALNNAIVTGFLLGWTWQVPVGAFGAVAVALGLLFPFARERAPEAATAA